MTPLEKAQKIAQLLDEKLAKEIKIIKVEDLTVLCQYFVIAHGTNSTQVKMLADYVDVEMGKLDEKIYHREGYQSSSWVLLDFGDVISHVFYKETRQFYDLEHLWADGTEIPFEPKKKGEDK